MRALIEAELARCPRLPARLAIVDGQAREVLRQAEAAAVASGTATLEASLMRCPTILVYRTSRVSYWLLRVLLRRLQHVGLANIVSGRTVMPELLQDNLNPRRLADGLAAYLTQPAIRAQALADLDAVNALLGKGGAAAAAARLILDALPTSRSEA